MTKKPSLHSLGAAALAICVSGVTLGGTVALFSAAKGTSRGDSATRPLDAGSADESHSLEA